MNDDSDSEEFKSADNRHIVLTDSSEESCQSEPDDDDPVRMRRRKTTLRRNRQLGEQQQHLSEESKSCSASEVSDFSQDDKEEPFLEPDMMCSEHNLKVHSWHRPSRKMLCTYCI